MLGYLTSRSLSPDQRSGGSGIVLSDPALSPARDVSAETPADGYAHVPAQRGDRRDQVIVVPACARSQHHPARPRSPRALVELERSGRVVGELAQGRGKDAAVLDRLPGALPEVRLYRVPSITENRRPAPGPDRHRVPVVQRPLIPELARREDLLQRRVPLSVPLEYLLAVALGDPGLVLVGRVLVVGDDVDELAAPNSVIDNRAVWPEPETLIGLEPPRGQFRDRDDAAVADLPGELRRIGAEQARANGRMDAVGAEDDIGFDLGAIGEPRRSAVVAGRDCLAPCAEAHDVSRDRLRKDVEQISPVDRAPARAESPGRDGRVRSRDDAAFPGAQLLVVGLVPDRPDRILQAERPERLHGVRTERDPGTDLL